MVSRGRAQDMRREFFAARMVVLVKECDVPRSKASRLLLAGLLVIARKDHVDRLIIDRISQDSQERMSCSTITACFLSLSHSNPPSHGLRGSGGDLSNFFYMVLLYVAACCRNAGSQLFWSCSDR